MDDKINLADKLAACDEHSRPKIVARALVRCVYR
jgi:hypothetical protein